MTRTKQTPNEIMFRTQELVCQGWSAEIDTTYCEVVLYLHGNCVNVITGFEAGQIISEFYGLIQNKFIDLIDDHMELAAAREHCFTE